MSNHPFRPLRHRAVRMIWAAGMFSDIGTWVQLVVVGSLVARESGSALKTGLIAMATLVPPGLCAPIGGLLADRYDRRKVFIAGLFAQGTVTAVLAGAIAAGARNPLVLSGIILVSSSVGSLANPAYSAMLPDLVPPEELLAMVALGIYSWNSGRIIGPLIAGAVGVVVSPAWTVGFNAITFLFMAAAVSTVRRTFVPPHDEASAAGVRERFIDGWRALNAVPGCRAAVAIVVLLNLTIAPFMGLLPIYAKAVFDEGTRLAGTFSSVQGVGAIIGTVSVTTLAFRLGRARIITVLIPVLFVSYLGFALAPSPLVAAIAVAGLGLGSSSLFVTGMSVGQRDAPDAQRGRVLSLIQAAMGISYGLGILWIGGLGDWIGLRPAFVAGAVSMVALALLLSGSSPGWGGVVDGRVASPSRPVDLDELGTSPLAP